MSIREFHEDFPRVIPTGITVTILLALIWLFTRPIPIQPDISKLVEGRFGPTVRLEQLSLFPEEGNSVNVPREDYLEKLATVCEKDWLGEVRTECNWSLGEVWKGRRDITSRVAPLYGRLVFDEKQINYIRWAERRTAQLLEGFERGFIRENVKTN